MKFIGVFLFVSILAQAEVNMSSPDQLWSVSPESEVCETPAPLKQAVKISQPLRPCFAMRPNPKSAEAMIGFQSVTQVLESEAKVCGCLEKRYPVVYHAKMPRPGPEQLKDSQIKLIELNLKQKQQMLDEIASGVAMQLKNTIDDTDTYNTIMKDSNVGINNVNREALNLVSKTDELVRTNLRFDLMNKKDNLRINRAMDAAQKVVPPTTEELEKFTQENIAPGSCISMQMYFAHTQRITNPKLIDEMNQKQFKSEDWKLEHLKAQYDAASLANDQEKSAYLEAKILFLKLNPLHAGLLMAGDEHNDDKIKVLNLLSWKALANKCTGDVACNSNAILNEATVRKELSLIYKKDSVKGAVQWAMQQQMLDEYNKNDVKDLLKIDVPQNRSEMEKVYKSLTSKDISSCHSGMKSAKQQGECDKNFPLYCSQLSSLREKFNKGELSSVLEMKKPSEKFDHLDFFERDPAKNEGFQKFSKLLCQTPRMNSKREVKTFEDYKKDKCSAKKCDDTLEAQLKLLKAYNNEYNHNQDGSLPSEVDQAAAQSVAGHHCDQEELREAEVVARSSGRPRTYPRILGSIDTANPYGSDESDVVEKRTADTHQSSSSQEPEQAEPYDSASVTDTAPVAPASTVSNSIAAPAADAKTSKAQAALSDEVQRLKDEKARTEKELEDIKSKSAQEAAERKVSELEEKIARKEEELRRVSDKGQAKNQKSTAKKDQKAIHDADTEKDEAAVDASKELSPKARAIAQKAQKEKEAAAAAQKRAAQEIAEEASREAQHQAQAAQAQAIANAQSGAQAGASAQAASGNSSAIASGKGKDVSGGMNSALLAKYKENPADAQGPQQALSALEVLATSSAVESKVIPNEQQSRILQVTPYDQVTLLKLYADQVKNQTGPVVRMKIEISGKTLEVLAIRDGKEVRFEPAPEAKVERRPASSRYEQLKSAIKPN